MYSELISQSNTILFKQNDENFQLHKRISNSYTNHGISAKYCKVHDLESRHLIFELLSTNKFSPCFTRYSASTIYALAFGKRLTSNDAYELRQVEKINNRALAQYIIDLFPFLLHIPTFMSPWKQKAAAWHLEEKQLLEKSFEHAMATPSWN